MINRTKKIIVYSIISIVILILLVLALSTIGWIHLIKWLIRDPSLAEIRKAIFDFQTIIGSLFGIIIASVAAALLFWQITIQEKIAISTKENKRRAYQSILPLILSYYFDYCDNSILYLENILQRSQGMRIDQHSLSAPNFEIDFSSDKIANLVSLIEHIDEENHQNIFRFVFALQIQNARLKSLIQRSNNSSSIVVRSNILELILNSAEVYARCECLLLFGRGDTNQIQDIKKERIDSIIRMQTSPTLERDLRSNLDRYQYIAR